MRALRGWETLLVLLASAACDTFADDAPPRQPPIQDGGTTAGAPMIRPTRPPPLTGTGGSITLPVEVANDLGAECDTTRTVTADSSALIVRDPEVLAEFSLQRTLERIADSANVQLTAEQLLQRLFDTENASANSVFPDVPHCDDANNVAFKPKAVDCPRAEGRLATSTSMFTPGSEDFFAPVALVNRFDLAPSDRSTCGEYRIVYAKHSGLTDPAARVFLIFEAALFNFSGSLATCRTVADLWQGLAAADVATQRARLSALYYTGVGGLSPVIEAAHLSASGTRCQYTGQCGQIRLGQRMQEPFQFRQFRLLASTGPDQLPRLAIEPTEDSQSLRPQLFDLPSSDPSALAFRGSFRGAVDELGSKDLARMRTRLDSAYDAGESAVSGAASPSFAQHLAASPADEVMTFTAELGQLLGGANSSCPSDDLLTPDTIIQRATALTCAGCHAPEQVLSPGRKLGCGGVWPLSLGQTHIDERGELSPALTELFLPHRARVLSTFLQACDLAQIEANLQPVPPPVRVECFPAGTPIALADGTSKPIELVGASEWILTFDPVSRTVVPAQVTERIVRRDAQRFVRINDSLVATDNHPFFTDSGWVRAMDLRVGAALLSLTEAHQRGQRPLSIEPRGIARLTVEAGSGLTYNLHVDGHHGYFAGGVLVHDQP